MIYSNGVLYYSNVKSGYVGLYSYKNGVSTKISSAPAEGLIDVNGKIYFLQIANEYTLDYPTNSYSGANGKLYVYNGSEVIKVS